MFKVWDLKITQKKKQYLPNLKILLKLFRLFILDPKPYKYFCNIFLVEATLFSNIPDLLYLPAYEISHSYVDILKAL